MPVITCHRSFLSNLYKIMFISVMFIFLCAPAWASTIDISYSPSPVEMSVGDQWDLNIYLTGELEDDMSLAMMSFRFRFDEDVISFSGASFGTWVESWGDYYTTSVGDTYDYGDYTGINLTITGTQTTDSFGYLDNVLFATVSFNVAGVGTSIFDAIGVGYGGSWPSGTYVYIDDPEPAEIAVSEAASVPEPTTMFLLASGLVGLVGFRRKFRKS